MYRKNVCAFLWCSSVYEQSTLDMSPLQQSADSFSENPGPTTALIASPRAVGLEPCTLHIANFTCSNVLSNCTARTLLPWPILGDVICAPALQEACQHSAVATEYDGEHGASRRRQTTTCCTWRQRKKTHRILLPLTQSTTRCKVFYISIFEHFVCGVRACIEHCSSPQS